MKFLIYSLVLVAFVSAKKKATKATTETPVASAWSGRGPRSGTFRTPHIPCLPNATSDQLKEFFSIAKNATLTKGELKTAMTEFASRAGDTVKTCFAQKEANLTKFLNEVKANRTTTLNALPQKIKEIQDIIDNQDLTLAESFTQIKEIYGNLTAAGDYKLVAALQLFIPFGGASGRGHFHGGHNNVRSRFGGHQGSHGEMGHFGGNHGGFGGQQAGGQMGIAVGEPYSNQASRRSPNH